MKHQAANWANRSGYPVYLYVFEHTSTNSKNEFDNQFSQRILHANDLLGKDANLRQINRTSSYKVRIVSYWLPYAFIYLSLIADIQYTILFSIFY